MSEVNVRITGRSQIRVPDSTRANPRYYAKNDIVAFEQDEAERLVNAGAAELTEESSEYIRANQSEVDQLRNDLDAANAALAVAQKNFAIMKEHYESVKNEPSPVASLTGVAGGEETREEGAVTSETVTEGAAKGKRG